MVLKSNDPALENIALMPHHLDIVYMWRHDDYKKWEKESIKRSVEGRDLGPYKDYIFKHTRENIKGTAEFLRKLSRSPSTKIKVVATPKDDSMCHICDGYGDGKCKNLENYYKANPWHSPLPPGNLSCHDEVCLDLYGLSVGQSISVKDFLSTIQRISRDE